MNELNFKFKFTDSALVETSEMANEVLSSLLSNDTKNDAVKLFGWSIELRRSGVLNIDDSDKEKLKSIVTDFTIPAFAKAQLLKVFTKEQ